MITRGTAKKSMSNGSIQNTVREEVQISVNLFFRLFVCLILRSIAFLVIALAFCLALVSGLVVLRMTASAVILICDASLDMMIKRISTTDHLVDDMICSKVSDFWPNYLKN